MALGASAPTREERGGHIVAAARLQLLVYYNDDFAVKKY